ncbi:YtzH-like family protein [Desertibacillus haloalkaliphilus]|uniref:YtzH-like family protein n=1 Tax=Desertibacillus haloalkaliphilus TaxID=1328930 RepID=UPI001C258A05|nr:YtzH-like family protein [Desertibacillus haloalkaliphilus]MBU8905252.1 YtzH-like family protein [Desertibacillus haloalkaliphilus]
MPMNYHHQLGLLSDILKNQASEQYMTTDEYNQVQRLTSSLLNNANIDPNVQQTLAGIQQATQTQGGTSYFAQQDVEQWINTINQY